jgi:hypothetical protein
MRKLFESLRSIVNRSAGRHHEEEARIAALVAVFETRIDVLMRHAEQAMSYEETLTTNFQRLDGELAQLRDLIEAQIDAGKDRNALEYLRLAVRLRPQRELVAHELHAFHAVADALIVRVNTLVAHVDEAREYVRNAHWSPAKADYIDSTLTKLTRYFVMLERVSLTRRQTLNERLMSTLLEVIDDRRLDLELATYILQRRRALAAG